VLRIRSGHGEGNYFAPPDVSAARGNRQVVFATRMRRRVDETRRTRMGSAAIAGSCNERATSSADAASRAGVRACSGTRRRLMFRVGRRVREAGALVPGMIDRQVLERTAEADEYERIVAFLGREPT
jgi:hypothetical protein